MTLDMKYKCDRCKRKRVFEVVDKLEKCASQRFGGKFYIEYFYIVKCVNCCWSWWE